MRKNLTFIMIFYVVGIILSAILNIETIIVVSTLTFLTALLIKIIFKRDAKILISVISFVMGIVVSLSIAYVSTYPYKHYFNKNSEIICNIVSYPTKSDGYVKYDAKIIVDSLPKGAPVTLYVDNRYSGKIYNYGDVYKVKNASVVPYHGLENFRHLANDGKYARISAKDYNIEKLSKRKVNFVKEKIYLLRDYIIKSSDKHFPENISAVIRSITVADKTSLSDDVKSDFKKSGLSHLLAISGFHLSIIVSYALYLVEVLSKNKKRILSFVVTTVICGIMIIITGGTPSVIRASVMLILSRLACVLSREYDSKTALYSAGSLIIIINPFSIYDVGFLLSFFATLGIVSFYGKIDEFLKPKIKNKYLRETIGITLSAQLGVTPIFVLFLQTLQILSVFVNIIAVPLFSTLYVFTLLFLILSAFPFIMPIIGGLVFVLTNILLKIADLFSKIPFVSIDVTGVYFIMDTLFSSAAILCVAVFLRTKKRKEKILSIILAIVLFFAVFYIKNGSSDIKNVLPNSNISTNLKVSFIDVGQGDCALVQADEKTMLIDGGSSSNDDVGEYVIKPYLLSNGVSKLDYAVVSHYHDDHYNGIIYLLDNFDVGTLVLSGASNSEDFEEKQLLESVAKRNNIPIYYFYEKDAIKLNDETIITAYSPLRNISYSSNNESLVLKLENPDLSFLFTGDIEKSGENKLRSMNLKADVLKVAHHGSNTSSTDEFLDNVEPQFAVISCGKNNSYRHPHDEIIEKLEKRRIPYYRTDEDGDVVFNVTKDGKVSIN